MKRRTGALLVASLLALPVAGDAQPAAAGLTLSNIDSMIRREFASADRNRDGYLDRQELRTASQGYRRQQELGLDLLDWTRWDRTDRDGDGRIDYVDIFEAYFARLEDLDADGDGTLSRAELQAGEREEALYVCPARRGIQCTADAKNEAVRQARAKAGRLFNRLDWWARRYYRFRSNLDAPFYGAVRDSRAWHALWDRMLSRQGAKPVNPSVDFSKEMLLVAAMGQQRTGGYRIQIISVRDARRELVATAVRTSPGRRCGATTAVTQPADIVKVPASDKKVRWILKDRATHCS